MEPLSLLVYLLIFVLVAAILYYVVQIAGLPQPWSHIVLAIVLLIALLWLARSIPAPAL